MPARAHSSHIKCNDSSLANILFTHISRTRCRRIVPDVDVNESYPTSWDVTHAPHDVARERTMRVTHAPPTMHVTRAMHRDAPSSSRERVRARARRASDARHQPRRAHPRARTVCRDGDGTSRETDAAPLNGKSVVVIGAGPAGALTSIHLASLGFEVDVYERRGASNKVATSARTYNVVLNRRGLDALEAGGITLDDELCVHLSGGVRHGVKSGAVFSSQSFNRAVSVNRAVLAATIVREASDKYGDRIRFHFNRSLAGVNFNTQTAVFEKFEGEDVCPFLSEDESLFEEKSYDLLIGADGVRSRVRAEIVEDSQGTFVVKQVTDGMNYKSVMLPKLAGAPRGMENDWSRAFHTWRRGQASVLAPPNPDGTHSAVVILPENGEWTWDKIEAPQQVDRLFATKFPDAFSGNLPSKTSSMLAKQKASPGGTTTTVSSMVYKDNVLLIGDAAHSCWPSLGQGANVALETTHALRVTLEEMGDDLPKALKMFNELRKPQVDAAARLSQGGFGGSMNRTIGGVLMARMVFISILHTVLPTVFHRPALFEISNTAYSYDEVEKMMKRESFGFCASLVFGVVTFWYLVFQNPTMRRSLSALVRGFISAAIGAS